MAEGKAAYSYQYPAQYVQDMLRGRGGIFGLFPGMNQYMQSQFANIGAPGSSPYTYTGPRISGFAPREEMGMQMSDAALGSYLPYLARSQGLSEEAIANMMRGTTEGSQMLRESAGAQYAPGTAYKEYMDPYTTEVIEKATADIREDTEKAKAGARDRAISQGAFGGSRGRLGAEEIERGAARSIGDMASRLRSQGYGTAQQQAMGEFGRQQAAKAAGGQGIAGMAGALGQGLGAFGDRYSNLAGTLTGMQGQDISRTMQMGAMDRARNQALMDLAYQNYVGQYNMPMTLMGQYGNMLSSLGPLAGGIGYSGKWPTGAAGSMDDPTMYGGAYYNPGAYGSYWPPQPGDGTTTDGTTTDGTTTDGTTTDGTTTDTTTDTDGDGIPDSADEYPNDPTNGQGTEDEDPPPDDDYINPGYGIPMSYGSPGYGYGYGYGNTGGGHYSGYGAPGYNYYGGYNRNYNTGTGTGTGGGTTGAGTAASRGGLIELIRSRRRG